MFDIWLIAGPFLKGVHDFMLICSVCVSRETRNLRGNYQTFHARALHSSAPASTGNFLPWQWKWQELMANRICETWLNPLRVCESWENEWQRCSTSETLRECKEDFFFCFCGFISSWSFGRHAQNQQQGWDLSEAANGGIEWKNLYDSQFVRYYFNLLFVFISPSCHPTVIC